MLSSDPETIAALWAKYCLISPTSFSCGKLFPAFFKGSTGITLLGKTSGGGTCAVLPFTTASGAVFTISSPLQISMIKNGAMYRILPDGVDERSNQPG